jgi:hypothetical protein
VAYLWEIFLDLHNPAGNGFGPTRISYQEIEAYGRLTGRRLGRWETALIIDLSEGYLIYRAESQKGGPNFNAVGMDDAQSLRSLIMGPRAKPPVPPPATGPKIKPPAGK